MCMRRWEWIVYLPAGVIICSSRVMRAKGTLPAFLNIIGGVWSFAWTWLLAVAMNPRAGLNSFGRSCRNPSHS